MEFKIGNEAVASYKRLDYTPWHAIAEFIDNSTQAYFNHRKELDEIFKKEPEKRLVVRVTYDEAGDVLRVFDNAVGMDEKDLERALTVGKPPADPSGRSRYGMGLKTAACWFGDKWSIDTKKLGKEQGIRVEVNVADVIAGKKGVKSVAVKGKAKGDHYTIIEVTGLHRKLKGRTKGKIKQFLSSMYREDLTKKTMDLFWADEPVTWKGVDDNIYVGLDGRRWKKDFKFDVNKKSVHGWVGILQRGSREDAGFSILHCGRVIKGWPDSWRPTSLFGQDQGTNDLINQRLIGEIHLDDFEVTHTKDNILWSGDEEELVLEKLKEKCSDYREESRKSRNPKSGPPVDSRGPNDKTIALAVEDLKAEITSSEMIDALRLDVVPPEKVVKEIKAKILEDVEPAIPILEARIDEIVIKVYLEALSASDPYVTVSSDKDHEVIVTVNKSHPHFAEYATENEVINYLKHCVYDAVAEWKTRKKMSRIDPDTVKLIKDQYLRVKLKIEEHALDAATDSEE